MQHFHCNCEFINCAKKNFHFKHITNEWHRFESYWKLSSNSSKIWVKYKYRLSQIKSNHTQIVSLNEKKKLYLRLQNLSANINGERNWNTNWERDKQKTFQPFFFKYLVQITRKTCSLAGNLLYFLFRIGRDHEDKIVLANTLYCLPFRKNISKGATSSITKRSWSKRNVISKIWERGG